MDNAKEIKFVAFAEENGGLGPLIPEMMVPSTEKRKPAASVLLDAGITPEGLRAQHEAMDKFYRMLKNRKSGENTENRS